MTSAAQFYEAALALHRKGDLDGAAAGYDAALAVDSAHAKALQMRGVVHLQRRESALAVEFIRRAIEVDRSDAGAFGNLTAALLPLARYDEAIEAGRKGVELNPAAADIWANLATALTRRDRYPEAADAYQRAIALSPGRAGLHSGLGTCLEKLGRLDEALASHRRALELAPERHQYRVNLSSTLKAMARMEEAEKELRFAIAQAPEDPEIKAALGQILKDRGNISEAVAAYEQASRQFGPSRLDNSLMFLRNYVNETSIQAQLDQAIRSGNEVASKVQVYSGHDNSAESERVIRVGFVSSDFRQHAVGLFLMGVLRELDPAVIATYAYSGSDPKDDEFNLAFRSFIPHWRSTFGWSEQDLAERIRHDRIDILVDLSGPTSGGRPAVFAMKPAPVAIGWLGYSGTTGLQAIDYVLGDAEVLPEGVDQLSEAPWRLPDAYLCFSPQPEVTPVAPLPALANGYVTFGSLNNTRKLSTATLDTWARVLHAVPDSRLRLKGRSKASPDEEKRRLVDEFVARGIAEERITVLDWVEGWLQHLPFYYDFDIGLDPFPYNGTTTTCESLLMGVPVLTLRGDRFISRVGATIMHNTGLDEWIADDLETYVSKAVAFASDVPALSRLRQNLRAQFVGSPMCDAPRFARNFEAALRGMWRVWCEGQQSS